MLKLKKESSFGMYPLCVDVVDLNVGELQTFDTTCGAVHCAENHQNETDVLGLVEIIMDSSCYGIRVDALTMINGTTQLEIKERQMYKDKSTSLALMGKYKIDKGFNFRVKRSDSKSYVLKCFSDECVWIMKASCMKNIDVFKIRYFYDVHTCPMRERILNNVEATLSFVSGVTAPKLVNHERSHTPNDIVDDVKADYGVNITYQKAWRGKERALEMLKSKLADGYSQMSRYIHMLNTVYPNSYIKMKKTVENEFIYVFIAIRPLMRGFQFCRPVVVVDGAHLNGAYKSTFL